ncbi:MAG: hypothetical protein HY789_12140, partial [Deltaproteobacteria bacterium]|nr:hypothetical protein [Deltaproteobacteria bacterium]
MQNREKRGGNCSLPLSFSIKFFPAPFLSLKILGALFRIIRVSLSRAALSFGLGLFRFIFPSPALIRHNGLHLLLRLYLFPFSSYIPAAVRSNGLHLQLGLFLLDGFRLFDFFPCSAALIRHNGLHLQIRLHLFSFSSYVTTAV